MTEEDEQPKYYPMLEVELTDDVADTLDMLEAAVRRCCRACDEPLQIYEHLRQLIGE